MIWRNLPLLLLALVFITLGSVLFVKAPQHPLRPRQAVDAAVPEPEEVIPPSFAGRMEMPSIDNLYVLDNSAGRDLQQFQRFLQGRAAGLHWVASEHFKNEKSQAKHHKKHSVKDVYMGLKLSIDSTGTIAPTILFCNTKDQEFSDLVLKHINTFWKYPRGTTGKFVVWMPILWRADWK